MRYRIAMPTTRYRGPPMTLANIAVNNADPLRRRALEVVDGPGVQMLLGRLFRH